MTSMYGLPCNDKVIPELHVLMSQQPSPWDEECSSFSTNTIRSLYKVINSPVLGIYNRFGNEEFLGSSTDYYQTNFPERHLTVDVLVFQNGVPYYKVGTYYLVFKQPVRIDGS